MTDLKRDSIENSIKNSIFDTIEDTINKQIIEASLNRKCKCQKK